MAYELTFRLAARRSADELTDSFAATLTPTLSRMRERGPKRLLEPDRDIAQVRWPCGPADER